MDKYLNKLTPLENPLKGITTSLGLVGFGKGMISIFIPLLLLNAGVSINGIALFYLIYSLTKLSIDYSLLKFTVRFGPSKALALAFTANALQLLGLLLFQKYNLNVYLLASAFMLAIANSLSANSQHLFISMNAKSKSRSSNIASMQIFLGIVAIFAPILGAIIATNLGDFYIYIFAGLMFLLAIIPLFSMQKYEQYNRNQKLKYNLKGAAKRDILGNICFNAEVTISQLIWPIYLAIVIGSFKTIGYIAAIGALFSFIVIRFAGSRGDSGKNSSTLKHGGVLMAFIDFLRIFSTTTGFITLVNAAYQSIYGYVSNAWTSIYYHHAKKIGPQFIVSMEIGGNFSNTIIWGILYILTTTKIFEINTTFSIMFLIAAVSALMLRFIRTDNIKQR
jgi:hypothetical protein